MIPVVLPITIVALAFLALTMSGYVIFAGYDRLMGFARSRGLLNATPEGITMRQAEVSDFTPSPATGKIAARVEGYAMPRSLHYHQGHAWVASQDGDTAVVGLDEFASKLIGKPDSVTLPRVGDRCRQGEKGWSLSRGKKLLDMLFPLDGEVIAVNERAISNPELLAEDPYGSGWLFVVRTHDTKRNLRNLLRGSFARRWMEESAAELRSAFSGRLGLVFQDGGLPEEGLADSFDEADWRTLVNRIFTFEPEDPDQ